MSEFPTEQHKASHLAALERERQGYEARKPLAARGRDPYTADMTVEQLDQRIADVDAELERVRGVDVEPAAEEAAEPAST